MIVVSAIIWGFFLNRRSSSTWVGIGVAVTVLFWFRFRRLRWVALLGLLILIVSGSFFTTAFEFAGGIEDWERTGGGRLILIGRVLEDTIRNPITGIGPVAYRFYGATRPLAIWKDPLINAHNNYVDIYSFFGITGLLWFVWLVYEIGRLIFDLIKRISNGFEAGYLYGMLGVGAGSLVIMGLADWILPFVYNIGFVGFQASMLVWLFLGGLVSLDKIKQ